MPPVRKTLGNLSSPCYTALMRLIETQSKPIIVTWCVDYAEKHFLPIYEQAYPGDRRPHEALEAAREWLAGKIKLPAAKEKILAAHAAAREAEGSHAAQAAARAIAQAASSIHAPTHSLGMACYGAAAAAYDRVGTSETAEVYGLLATEECGKMEAALRAVAVENEQNPAKINWRC